MFNFCQLLTRRNRGHVSEILPIKVNEVGRVKKFYVKFLLTNFVASGRLTFAIFPRGLIR